MTLIDLPLAYIGPESALPFASFIAAIIGAILMFWSYIWRMTKMGFHRLVNGKRDVPVLPANTPELAFDGAAAAGTTGEPSLDNTSSTLPHPAK